MRSAFTPRKCDFDIASRLLRSAGILQKCRVWSKRPCATSIRCQDRQEVPSNQDAEDELGMSVLTRLFLGCPFETIDMQQCNIC